MEANAVKNKEKNNKHVQEESVINLHLLEQKVVHLIELVHMLKTEKSDLMKKNQDLNQQILALEMALVSETKALEGLSQEKLSAEVFVNQLLHSIDSLIENEQ